MVYLPGTSLGAFRAYFFGFFICTSGFLFGYDTGIVGMFPPTPAPNSPMLTNPYRRRPHPQILPK